MLLLLPAPGKIAAGQHLMQQQELLERAQNELDHTRTPDVGALLRTVRSAQRLRAASSPMGPCMGQGDAADIVVVLMSCCFSGPAERPLDTVATYTDYRVLTNYILYRRCGIRQKPADGIWKCPIVCERKVAAGSACCCPVEPRQGA